MACSSTVSTDGYEICQQTVCYLKNAGFHIARDSPLDLCISLIGRGILDDAAKPTGDFEELQLHPFTEEGQKFIYCILTRDIPFEGVSINLVKVLTEIKTVSGSSGRKYHGAFLTGSCVPFCIEHPFIHQKEISGSNSIAYCQNIDVLVRVKLESGEDARDRFENDIVAVLKEITQLDFGGYEGGSKAKHHEERWTIFTFGNESMTVNLMFLFLDDDEVFPELYTKNAYLLPIDDLIDNKEQELVPLQPKTIGITSTMLYVDRMTNICRYLPYYGSDETDSGLFRWITTMKTFGDLGVQNGLQDWTLKVYLHAPKKTQHICDDLKRNFFDHIVDTFGAFLAHWLHWMAAMNGIGDIQQEMTQYLDYPVSDSEPDYLKRTYQFIKKYPAHFSTLMTILEFSTLLSYLKNPEGSVTCGMWDGWLALRTPLDGLPGIYFQFVVNPQSIFVRTIQFLEQCSKENQVDEDAQSLLKSYFDWYEISGPFEIHPNAQGILQDRMTCENTLNKIWGYLEPVDTGLVTIVVEEMIDCLESPAPAIQTTSVERQESPTPPRNVVSAQSSAKPDPFTQQLEQLTTAADMKIGTLKKMWTALKGAEERRLADITDPQWKQIFDKMEKSKDFSLLWEALYKRFNIKKTWEPVIETVFKKLLTRIGRLKGANEELKVCTEFLLPMLDDMSQQVQWERRVESVNDLGVAILNSLTVIKRYHPAAPLKSRALAAGQRMIRQIDGPRFFGIPLSIRPRGSEAYQTAKNALIQPQQNPRSVTHIKLLGRKMSPRVKKMVVQSVFSMIIAFMIYFIIVRMSSMACTNYVDDTSSPGWVKTVPPARYLDIIHPGSFWDVETSHLVNEIGHFLCINCKCKLFAPEMVPLLLQKIAESRVVLEECKI